MDLEVKERVEIEDEYKWDLSSMYESDEAWKEDLNNINPLIEKVASFKGKLVDARSIRDFFDSQNEMDRKMDNLVTYASMRRSMDTREEAAQAMQSVIYAKYVELSTAISFAEPEILALPDETLKALIEDPILKDFSYILTKLLRQKSHTLSETEEKLLATFGETFAVPREASSNLMNADMTFENCVDSEGNEQELSNAAYIPLQMASDRVLRKNSFEKFYKTYKNHINTLAATYTGALKADVAEAKVRHYSSARNMYTSYENVPEFVYDNLIESVREHMAIMYKYVDFRKNVLEVSELHYYDLYAPLSEAPEIPYPFEECKKLVLRATAPLGSKYTDIVKSGFENRWIDVYPNKGKRSGAFSS
ncbi:MAG: oligoendopeptidase F, partial [Lachnospiraceae bacterium]|nr:oligoendopeptidase F [Lachnospiraceae bacterium]